MSSSVPVPLPRSFWLCVTVTGWRRGLNTSCAKSCTTSVQAAENNNVCLSLLMPPEIVRTASSRPSSNIRSASSNTKYVTLSRLIPSASITSVSRPGVATTMWLPTFRAATCRASFGPPQMLTARRPRGPWLPTWEFRMSRWASTVICATSSRTGARTSAMGVAASLSNGCWASMCTIAGSKYARVLPLPGLAMPIRSWPLSTSGSACAWTGSGASRPLSRMACME
mmetsp:Transcript_79524/g.251210  ORF Transcript_79524/g.251210 Transcript_79524/m.251210 type:complete len:226 (+) Transcript_79524:641-1318(+)